MRRRVLVLARRSLQQLQHGLSGQPCGVTAKERGGRVQGVTGAHPDDIEEQTIGFAGIGPGAAAEHLLIEQGALGGARDDDTIDGGFIKAFGEHGTVGHDARFARVQPLEDGAAGRQRRGAIQGLGRDAGRAERSRPWHGPGPP